MHDQLHHPLEGLISERHREHFFTQENYERSRELRGEHESTKLTHLINSLKEALSEVEDQSLRQKLSGLIDEITKSALRYLDTRIDLARIANQSYQDQEALMSADRTRRSAHLRLVDSIRIACRNITQHVDGFQVTDDVMGLIGDSTDERVRDRVAHAAIDLVWELLNREEDGARIPRSKLAS